MINKKNLLGGKTMIILNRKRIEMLSMMILMGMVAFTFRTAKVEEDTIETMALPVTNRVIVIDAGHGKPDEGAESSNGITEAQTNLKIALKLQGLLEQSGTTVILTRTDENAIYSIDAKTLKQKKVSDIKNRVKIGNENSADIFVSIHLNKIQEEKYWGWQCFYQNGNENSKILADKIQSNLNEVIQRENKRTPLKLDTVYIMKHVEIPTTIVECGFLSNQEEEKLLLEDSYQEKLAWGIYHGIMEYFSETEKR